MRPRANLRQLRVVLAGEAFERRRRGKHRIAPEVRHRAEPVHPDELLVLPDARPDQMRLVVVQLPVGPLGILPPQIRFQGPLPPGGKIVEGRKHQNPFGFWLILPE